MADTTVTDELQVLDAEAQTPELPRPNAVEIGQERAQLLDLATYELRERRDALQREINELGCRKQQLEKEARDKKVPYTVCSI